MNEVVSPASADEALDMLRSAMGYLAAADATAMTAEEQARCLRVLERVNSVGTAARTSVLSAFASAQGHGADAEYSPRAWLIHKTGVTKGAAMACTAWVRRAEDHPGSSRRWLRKSCRSRWPGSLPVDQPAAGRLPGPRGRQTRRGGRGGDEPTGPSELFGEIYEQSRSGSPDQDTGETFDDRAVRLITTFQGAGVLTGDLTPECAEAVAAVLDALAVPAGARTPGPSRSGTTTRCRRRCAGWSRRVFSPSGPGSR